jgi:hypothetical protein
VELRPFAAPSEPLKRPQKPTQDRAATYPLPTPENRS